MTQPKWATSLWTCLCDVLGLEQTAPRMVAVIRSCGPDAWIATVCPSLYDDEMYDDWSPDPEEVLDLFDDEPRPRAVCTADGLFVRGRFDDHEVFLTVLWEPYDGDLGETVDLVIEEMGIKLPIRLVVDNTKAT